jgi:uncharacterized integral membrane protein
MIFLFAFMGAVALVIVIIFSVQNAVPVTVAFYNWRFEASLAIVVFLSALAGMVIEVLFVLSLKLRKSVKGRVRPRNRATESTTPPAADNNKTPG